MAEAAGDLLQALRSATNTLTQDNYDTWVVKAEAELTELGIWRSIDPGYPEGPLQENEVDVNQRGRAYLLRHVSDEILNDIKDHTRAKGMWTALAQIHGRHTLLHTAMMVKQLGRFEKPSDMSMALYIRKVQDMCAKLAKGGIVFTDHMISVFLISCLPLDKYGPVVRSIRSSGNLNLLDVKNKLLVEEKSMRLEPEEEPAGALISKSTPNPQSSNPNQQNQGANNNQGRGRGRGRGGRGRGGRGNSRGGQNFNNNFNNFSNQNPGHQHQYKKQKTNDVRCYKCGEWGHYSYDCSGAEAFRSKFGANNNSHSSGSGSGAGPSGGTHLACISACGLTSRSQDNIWFLDSCASDPMTPDRGRFTEFEPAYGTVRIGRGLLQVKGRGKVDLKVSEKCGGWSITLSGVLFVPELEMNLISVKRLASRGVHTICKEDHAQGIRAYDGALAFTAIVIDGVYALEMVPDERASAAWCQESSSSAVEVTAKALRSASFVPWHERMGHLHEAALKKLPGLECSEIKDSPCGVCVRGKMTKVSLSFIECGANFVSKLWREISYSGFNYISDWLSISQQ